MNGKAYILKTYTMKGENHWEKTRILYTMSANYLSVVILMTPDNKQLGLIQNTQ